MSIQRERRRRRRKSNEGRGGGRRARTTDGGTDASFIPATDRVSGLQLKVPKIDNIRSVNLEQTKRSYADTNNVFNMRIIWEKYILLFRNISPIQVYDYMYGLRAVATVAEASEPPEPPPPGLTAGRAAALSSTCECKKSNLPVILDNARTHGNIQPEAVNSVTSPSRIVLQIWSSTHNSLHKLQAVLDFFTGQRTHSASVRLSVRRTVGRLVLLRLLTFGVGRGGVRWG